MFVVKCGAKARTNGHQPCRQPAMANGRCRLHGGKTCNTGANTPEGKLSQKRASWKHGLRSAEVLKENKTFQHMLKECKENLKGEL